MSYINPCSLFISYSKPSLILGVKLRDTHTENLPQTPCVSAWQSAAHRSSKEFDSEFQGQDYSRLYSTFCPSETPVAYHINLIVCKLKAHMVARYCL